MPTCLTSGICNISRSNRNSTRQLEVHSNIYSCGYRGSIWVSTAPMLIIDRKGFRVMSILHRTYRVTRLRVIYLLNTRQGVWEKITEKVSDTEKFRTAESYRRERSSDKFRWYRKVVSGYTIKSNWFRHMPDNSWRMPESFWKLFGIFWDKNRKCSGAAGATSDAFRRWKSLKPELFRNALKIILVGTGNVLIPHKYF